MFLKRSLSLLGSLISLLLFCGLHAAAQEASASLTTVIEGTMRDSSGAPVANATVSLTSNISPSQTAATATDGTYSFRGLRSGTYKIAATVAGFNDYQSQELALRAGQAARLDISLQVAGTTTAVDVTGDSAHVETEDPSVSDTLSSKEVVGYQLNGRNFIQLIALAPGVSNQTGTDEARVGVQGSAAYSVNGGRTEYNSFDLDGTDLLNVGFNGSVNTLIAYPSLDAIGEMKILTSNYGAMYGRTASGTVLVNTKSGTTEFHGDLYYFNRNEAFNARNFFDETKGAPLYRRHDVGGTLGGPLYIPGIYNKSKDKTFFFFSEEYRNEKTPYQFNQGVPSLAERNGDFSAVCPKSSQLINGANSTNFFLAASVPGIQGYPNCPGNPSLDTYQGVTKIVPYNVSNPGLIPMSMLDRNALIVLQSGIVPFPNRSGGCNSATGSCYDTTESEPTHWRQELFRVDHYLDENNHLTFRYIHDSWSTVTSTPQYGVVTNNVPTVQNNFVGPGISMVARYSQTLSPTWLNEAFVSYANSTITLTNSDSQNAKWERPAALDAACISTGPNPDGTPNTAGCGIGYLFNNGGGGKLPGLVFQGGSEYGGGFAVDTAYMPWTHKNPVYTFGDAMTKQWGKHFLQFGSEFIFYYRKQTNSVSGSATGDTQGLLTFTGLEGGNAFANFLTGRYQTFQQDSTQRDYRQRYQIAEPYLQDDWKVTPHLTFNLGLRLSLFGRYRELDNNVYNWLPSAYNSVLASQITIGFKGNLARPAVGQYGQETDIFFDPSQPDVHQLNGLVRCGYNGVPASCMSSHLVNPAPRIGFAWDPTGDGKTSIRGGYGIFFEHGTGNESNTGTLEGSAPLVLSMASSPYGVGGGLACIGGAHLLQCGDKGIVVPGQVLAYPLNVTSIPTKAVWPYVQQWSFSLQRELVQHLVANLAYVGSKGTHLTAESQINAYGVASPSNNPFGAHEPITSSTCTGEAVVNSIPEYILPSGGVVAQGNPAFNNLNIACADLNPTIAAAIVNNLRPYKGVGQIAQLSNIANSTYNAFQATLRRTSGPLTLGLSYTYSHSIDNSSDRFDPVPNGFDLGSNRASSNFDQRHLLNISYIYEVPTPKAWQRSRLLRNGLGGWQWSGITVFQSGIPFSVINDPSNGASLADNAGVANGIGTVSIQSYPDLVGDVHTKPSTAGDGTTIGPLLGNPGAFAAPRGLTLGDAGRNALRNPDRWNFDVSLFKNFKVSEKSLVEFRAEAFNVFNTTQFEIYNPAKRNQANNTVTCYGGADTNYSAGADQCLAGNSFLRPVDAHRPRTMQLALKFIF